MVKIQNSITDKKEFKNLLQTLYLHNKLYTCFNYFETGENEAYFEAYTELFNLFVNWRKLPEVLLTGKKDFRLMEILGLLYDAEKIDISLHNDSGSSEFHFVINRIDKKDLIKLWIKLALTPTKNINVNSNTSYGLKHYCEQAIGQYVSEPEFIECMNENYFKIKKLYSDEKSFIYNISKVVNKVTFFYGEEQISNYYNRAFGDKSKDIKIQLKP